MDNHSGIPKLQLHASRWEHRSASDRAPCTTSAEPLSHGTGSSGGLIGCRRRMLARVRSERGASQQGPRRFKESSRCFTLVDARGR